MAFTGLIVVVVRRLNVRTDELSAQNTKYVRELYERDREAVDLKREPGNGNGGLAPHSAYAPSTRQTELTHRETVDFAMLLLTLQDIVRRISTNVDMDSLVRTIIDTARSSLKCGECRLYLWDAPHQTLTNALPPRDRDQWDYVPNPRKGMARWVLENRQILTKRSVEGDYVLQELLNEETHIPEAIAPLTTGGELLGLLVVDDAQDTSQTFDRLLYVFANVCALGIKNAQLFKRIEEMARRDGLTGLLNHATFRRELTRLFDEAQAYSRPLAVIMSDVDHFKKFNDTYGHQAGDRVLQEVARLWQAIMPKDAVLARYGGEEFICALPREGIEQAWELAELLRDQLEAHIVDFKGHQLSVTASFGITVLDETIPSAGDLVRTADEALYEAKAQGRNCVVRYQFGTTRPQDPSAELVPQMNGSESIE